LLPPAHAREPIDPVHDDAVSATSYALHRDRVATEAGDETIALFWLGGPASDAGQRAKQEKQGKLSSVQNHGVRSSFDSD